MIQRNVMYIHVYYFSHLGMGFVGFHLQEGQGGSFPLTDLLPPPKKLPDESVYFFVAQLICLLQVAHRGSKSKQSSYTKNKWNVFRNGLRPHPLFH